MEDKWRSVRQLVLFIYSILHLNKGGCIPGKGKRSGGKTINDIKVVFLNGGQEITVAAKHDGIFIGYRKAGTLTGRWHGVDTK